MQRAAYLDQACGADAGAASTSGTAAGILCEAKYFLQAGLSLIMFHCQLVRHSGLVVNDGLVLSKRIPIHASAPRAG